MVVSRYQTELNSKQSDKQTKTTITALSFDGPLYVLQMHGKQCITTYYRPYIHVQRMKWYENIKTWLLLLQGNNITEIILTLKDKKWK